MLSGIKFIPREEVKDRSDSDHSSGKRKKSKSKKKKHDAKRSKRKTSYRSSSSDDDDVAPRNASKSFSDSEEDLNLKKKSKNKRRSISYDDDSLSSEEDGRVREKKKKKHSKEEIQEEKERSRESLRRENENSRKEMGLDWMLQSRASAATKTVPIEDVREEVAAEELQEVRPNPRELNPYLKDSGKGFPEDNEGLSSSTLLASSLVGDGGASWRLKALKRAQEQAAREGRKLDEVVEERWGSLGQLAASVASRRSAHINAHQHAIKDRRRGNPERSERRDQDKSQSLRQRDYLHDVSSRHPEMKKPKYDSTEWRKRKTVDVGENKIISDALSSLNKFSNDGSFMDKITAHQNSDSRVSERDISENVTSEKEHAVPIQGLTTNQLAAKAMQLRLKGKHEEAEKLLEEVESIRQSQDSNAKPVDRETKGNPSRYGERRAPSQLKKREDDGDFNLAQKIIQDRKFTVSGQADDEYDFDDAPARKGKKKREVERVNQRSTSHRMLTQQERCQFCFESQSQPKHLIISIANFTYLMLPRYQPLVQGHCCILPLQHEASTRTVDDNVWEEMRNFKKCLIMMFAKQEKGVVFIETVIELSRQRRHCLVECIPLPRDLAEEAPMYFKKAIDEAEDEWSQHNAKKLIETTSEKGLRRVIPKDFPYFHVEFGLDRGFVHVIDDESNFNSNIGLNVIRGMLQLPEEDMYRRRRHELLETQKSAVAAFSREWEHFDWTKQLN